MSKTILSKLNRGVNGVNRFISTNMPFSQDLNNYSSHQIQFTDDQSIVTLANNLVNNLFTGFNVKSQSEANFDTFYNEIIKIFTHPEVILGSEEIANATHSEIKKDLESCFNKKEKLVFTLLGYPHKMPNPLYTHSTSADFSEIVSLVKLYKIMELIDSIYPYGVELKILTENSIFYNMSDLSNEEQMKYFIDLIKWEHLIDVKNLMIVQDIRDYHTQELEEEWKKVENEMIANFDKNDQDVIDKVESVMPTNFMTMNYRKIDPEILYKLFDENVNEPQLETIRAKYYNRALKESFYYLAYHQARYRLNFMEKQFPNSFRFTVAPKVGSFGINVLNKKSTILPYYGYLVVDSLDFKIYYYIDLPEDATAVYLAENLEYPFYYIKSN